MTSGYPVIHQESTASDGGVTHRTLVRLAFANSDAIHDLVKETEQTRIDLMAKRDTLVRTVKEAAMPAAPTAEMTALLEKPDYFGARNLPSDSEVAATFRDWLTAAKSQPAGQHAAALLAADRVLDFLDHDGAQVGEAARAAMKSLGAEYVHDELAGGDVYAHGLLRQAKAIAPPGPAADEVLLFQMERLAISRRPASDKRKIFLRIRLTESSDRDASPVP
jgi:hypothetical protein